MQYKKYYSLLLVAVIATTASFAQTLTEALIPVRVNVAATVSILPPDAAAGTGVSDVSLSAGVWDTLRIMVNANYASISHQSQRRAGVAASARYNRGNVSLELSPLYYQDATLSIHSINGRRVLSDKISASNRTSSSNTLNISRPNVAPGVYLLSVTGVDGNSYSTRFAHSGGRMSVGVALRGGNDHILRRDAAATAAGTWTLTAEAEVGHTPYSQTFDPVPAMNAARDISLSVTAAPENVFGNNPFVQTAFTADPAPVAFKDPRYSDRLFVYTSHDAPGSDWFTMSHLMCYSTTDMVNWTDHGAVMSDIDFSWAKEKTLWASQVIDRNGKFYAYIPIERGSGGGGSGPQIGVGISDSPFGPFVDAIGSPLISGNWNGDIDPSVFIDNDGQAYMYWGNPQLKYVKLKDNMIERDGAVVNVPMTEASFGVRSGEPDERYPTAYEEGPWIYRRNVSGLTRPYYLVYAGGPISEHLAYATASAPTGPWVYGGVIMPHGNGLAFTNHPGVVEFKGRSYLFYHDQRLRDLEGFTGGFTRSVAAAEFTYNADGSIPRVPSSTTGPAAIATLNPYRRVEATTINLSSRVKARRKNLNDRNDLQMCVYDIRNDGYIRIKAVDFGTSGASSFTASVANGRNSSASIEIRVGGTSATTGRLIGTLSIPNTGGWDNWTERTVSVESVTGVQDLYLVFKGTGSNELLRMEYWRFARR